MRSIKEVIIAVVFGMSAVGANVAKAADTSDVVIAAVAGFIFNEILQDEKTTKSAKAEGSRGYRDGYRESRHDEIHKGRYYDDRRGERGYRDGYRDARRDAYRERRYHERHHHGRRWHVRSSHWRHHH